jgi:hypothetical protein
LHQGRQGKAGKVSLIAFQRGLGTFFLSFPFSSSCRDAFATARLLLFENWVLCFPLLASFVYWDLFFRLSNFSGLGLGFRFGWDGMDGNGMGIVT